MPDVKTKRCIRKHFKDVIQSFNIFAYGFSLVHILNTKQLSKPSPEGEIMNGIRMKDDRPVL